MIKLSTLVVVVVVAATFPLDGASAFGPTKFARVTLFQPRYNRSTPRFSEEKSVSMDGAQSQQQRQQPPTRTLLQRLDELGMSLKPKALEAKEKVTTLRKPGKKFRYTLQSCALFALFIVYRAYRGFFVILPAVFREVYETMETTVQSPFSDLEPFVDDGNATSILDDINPQTGKVRWRTVITVSVLASIVTLSYVLSGAIRVLGSFFRTIFKTSSPSMSFLAAANEMETNESKIMNVGKKKMKKSKNMSGKINGDPSNDLAP